MFTFRMLGWVDRNELGICMLSILGIFILPSSEGGRGERKTLGASASFVVLGSSPLLGDLQMHETKQNNVHKGNST